MDEGKEGEEGPERNREREEQKGKQRERPAGSRRVVDRNKYRAHYLPPHHQLQDTHTHPPRPASPSHSPAVRLTENFITRPPLSLFTPSSPFQNAASAVMSLDGGVQGHSWRFFPYY